MDVLTCIAAVLDSNSDLDLGEGGTKGLRLRESRPMLSGCDRKGYKLPASSGCFSGSQR